MNLKKVLLPPLLFVGEALLTTYFSVASYREAWRSYNALAGLTYIHEELPNHLQGIAWETLPAAKQVETFDWAIEEAERHSRYVLREKGYFHNPLLKEYTDALWEITKVRSEEVTKDGRVTPLEVRIFEEEWYGTIRNLEEDLAYNDRKKEGKAKEFRKLAVESALAALVLTIPPLLIEKEEEEGGEDGS